MTAAPGLAGAATFELISENATGAVSDSFGTSDQPALSTDGRYVAFVSDAANLVAGVEDDNNARDVFLHDRVLGTITLVSHATGAPTRAATPGPGQYNSLDISADGRYVVFNGASPDLAPGAGDNGTAPDVFLWDRITGMITLVSHAAGAPGTAADGASTGVRISADGNFLVLTSGASNLVAGQAEPFPNARTADVFLWSRAANTMTLVSRKSGTTATAANLASLSTAISGDGNVVVFSTLANDLLPNVTVVGGNTQIYIYERSTNTLSLVSRSATGLNLAAGASQHLAVSAGGRYVAFASESAHLVPGQLDDADFSLDAFLYDRETGEMQLVSHKSVSPLRAGGIFGEIAISAGGRYVAFSSLATDLVPGQVDTNQGPDVFVWDRNTGLTVLASHNRNSATTAGVTGGATGATGSPKLSADGRFVAFHSIAVDLVHGQTDLPGTVDVFLYDQTTRNVTLVSRSGTSGSAAGNWHSLSPVLSADGSVTAFLSQANDLGEGQIDSYGFWDLFLYQRTSGEINSPSLRDPRLPSSLTDRYPSTLGGVSADGRSVTSEFLNVIFLRDTVADTTDVLGPALSSPDPAALSRDSVLSADGRWVAFLSSHVGAGSTERLYLYDRAAGTYRLVNHAPGLAGQGDGLPWSFALSADARWVAYQCSSCGLVPGHPGPGPGSERFHEIFLYDRVTGLNTLVSHAAGSPTARPDGQSVNPAISADGRYVAFWSTATNLFPGQVDTPATLDLFVFDREAGPTGSIGLVTNVPGSPATAAGTPASFEGPVHLSADGRFIAFQSSLTSLVPGQVDANGSSDLFLRDQFAGTSGTTVLVSHAASSAVSAGNQPSHSLTHEDSVSMSADGRFVVYESPATDLVAGATDTNNGRDVFLYDRLTGANSLVSHAGGAPLTAGNGESEVPRISADGSAIAFLSGAVDLAAGQTVQHFSSSSRSLYVQYRNPSGSTGTTAFVAQALKFGRPFSLFPGEEITIDFAPQLSANGRRIAFTSDSALILGDYNRTWDVYLWEGAVEPEEPEGPFPVTPCRLLDTRRRAERPILTSNVPRTVTAQGRCGVPATARKALVKVTVFNPSGKGNLRFYAGNATGAPSAILRFERATGRTESFILPLSPNGTLTILPFVSGRGTVHVAVEVNGYDD